VQQRVQWAVTDHPFVQFVQRGSVQLAVATVGLTGTALAEVMALSRVLSVAAIWAGLIS
jgi:hypothetical protein